LIRIVETTIEKTQWVQDLNLRQLASEGLRQLNHHHKLTREQKATLKKLQNEFTHNTCPPLQKAAAKPQAEKSAALPQQPILEVKPASKSPVEALAKRALELEAALGQEQQARNEERRQKQLLEQRLEQAEKAAQEVMAQNDRKNHELQHAAEQKSKEIEELRAQIASLQNEARVREAEIQNLSRTNESQGQHNRELSERLRELGQEQEKSQHTIETLEKRVAEKQREIQHLAEVIQNGITLPEKLRLPAK